MLLQPSYTEFIGTHTGQAEKRKDWQSWINVKGTTVYTVVSFNKHRKIFLFFWQAEAHTEQDRCTDKDD